MACCHPKIKHLRPYFLVRHELPQIRGKSRNMIINVEELPHPSPNKHSIGAANEHVLNRISVVFADFTSRDNNHTPSLETFLSGKFIMKKFPTKSENSRRDEGLP